MDREYLKDVHPEVIMLEPEGLDVAILGLIDDDDKPRLLYSMKGLIAALQTINEGWGYEEALEWYDFNIRSAYVGPNTPVYLELEWGD
ncbi:MAG: hypothetical protein CGW95_06605 [Phenylobacterium zucineum]|nr:MAG: hypothetical protein CGW95_06605 [Phenylobacterium zucineum]